MIMKILSTILLTLLIVLGACTSPQVSPDPFVRVSNGRLTVNGKPYYYIGTNFWYGAILGSQGQGGNRERLLRELDYLKALGINNLRVLVGADGKDGIRRKLSLHFRWKPVCIMILFLTGSISSCRSWINGICMPYFS